MGSTTDLRLRVNHHRQDLKRGRHVCRRLQGLWDGSRLEDFAVDVLARVQGDAELVEAENAAKATEGELLLNPGTAGRRPSTASKDIHLTEAQRVRFLASCPESDGCWEWAGRVDRQGYGSFKAGGKTSRAHRVAYFVHYGVQPGPLRVRHSCDNPVCVNPAHLSLGTDLDNGKDRSERLRSKRNLTPEVVAEVRAKFLSGSSIRSLNEEYGSNMRFVVRNMAFRDPSYQPPPCRVHSNRSRSYAYPLATFAEVHRQVAAGVTSGAIARSLGLTQAFVCQVISGYHKTPTTEGRGGLRDKEILRLTDYGVPRSEIDRIFAA